MDGFGTGEEVDIEIIVDGVVECADPRMHANCCKNELKVTFEIFLNLLKILLFSGHIVFSDIPPSTLIISPVIASLLITLIAISAISSG